MARQLLVLVLIIFLSFSPNEGDSSSYSDPVVDPQILTEIAVKTSIAQAQTVRAFIPPVHARRPMEVKQSQAVDDCIELYDLTVGFLTDGLAILTESSLDWNKAVDIQSYLSAALTNVVTCLDGLEEAKVNVRLFYFTDHISNASQGVSHCLALVNKFWIKRLDFQQTCVHYRRLLSDASVDDDFMSQYGSVDDGFPSWLSRADRRLLLQKTKSGFKLAANAVAVSQDGSGNFTTITDAIKAVPNNSRNRSVIYVTAGVYEEYVSVPSNKYNIMLIGDVRDVTVITGNRSVGDNSTTFNSATLAVVFQNCTLLARTPLTGQQNIFTAQGRTDPNQNTGISIHKWNVTAAPELVPVIGSFPTYLGRPWKLYSRTVYMKSYLDGLIQPVGWLEWSGDFALSTLYYGEFKNQGPESNTSQRVTWPGYHVMNTSDAQNFTVRSFINGDTWLPGISIPTGISL